MAKLRPNSRSLSIPPPVRFFSSSNQGPNDKDPRTVKIPPESSQGSSESQSWSSSRFSDVKASLKQRMPTSSMQHRKPFFNTSKEKPIPKTASLEEIRKNLSEFRRRSLPPEPNSPPQSQPISFQELYKLHATTKFNENTDSALGKGRAGTNSYEIIKDSLRQLKSKTTSNIMDNKKGVENNKMSLSLFKESLRLRPSEDGGGIVIGGSSEALPMSVFGKEMKKKRDGGEKEAAMKTAFVKMYSYRELGDKLRMLRPDRKTVEGQNWFSLEELNERLLKLREIEGKEIESKSIGGVIYKDLRDSLQKLSMSDEEKGKKPSTHRLSILGQLDGTPDYMLQPPKEHLVKQYFHPDNMSSAENLKLALQKVRDEFKMSESDCGSARVQVAQLTTKIIHLAKVLHKKDKHSRKGLQAMVQKRKKLLKYLRRTDWDSYCLVLSKLGLRDNPDYKN